MRQFGRHIGLLLLVGGLGAAAPYWALSQSDPWSNSPTAHGQWEECTIGVASGRATADGRAMIWKTRDTGARDNALYWNSGSRYGFLALIDAGDRGSSWISLNERGFAILNSVAYDLIAGGSGLGNGGLMSFAVGRCATVADFRRLLDSTNATGRTTNANFAVCDSSGEAAIFETAGASYREFNAADSLGSPKGYILRTNFSISGGGTTGLRRYLRTSALFDTFSAGDSVTPKSVLRYQMRDFADPSGVPYPIPFHGSVGGAPAGYIPVDETICRISSASGVVVHGVLPGERGWCSTFWVILGQPATGIAVPYWPLGGVPLEAADAPTAPLTNTANEILGQIRGSAPWTSYFNTTPLRNDAGEGIFPAVFLAEDLILSAADTLLASWRSARCTVPTVLRAESSYAAFALGALRAARDGIVGVEQETSVLVAESPVLLQNFPNPFNPATTVRYTLPRRTVVTLTVVTLLGQTVATLVEGESDAGIHDVRFSSRGLASGIYFIRLQADGSTWTRAMQLLR